MRKILLVAITIAILLALKVPPPVSAFVGWAHDGTGCKVGITGTASTGTCSLTVSHVGDTLVAACGIVVEHLQYFGFGEFRRISLDPHRELLNGPRDRGDLLNRCDIGKRYHGYSDVERRLNWNPICGFVSVHRGNAARADKCEQRDAVLQYYGDVGEYHERRRQFAGYRLRGHFHDPFRWNRLHGMLRRTGDERRYAHADGVQRDVECRRNDRGVVHRRRHGARDDGRGAAVSGECKPDDAADYHREPDSMKRRSVTRRQFERMAGAGLIGLLANRSQAFSDPDYTLVIIPDPQYLSAVSCTALYGNMMNRMVSDQSSWNIKAVIGVGDCQNNGLLASNSDYTRFAAAVAILNSAGIPYVSPPGNHDYDNNHPSDRANLSFAFKAGSVMGADTRAAWFGSGRSIGAGDMAYWVGSYDGTGANTAISLAIGSRRLLILSLEFYPGSLVLNWAQGLHDSYVSQGYEVHVTTHGYSDISTTLSFASRAGGYGPTLYSMAAAPYANSGKEMWRGYFPSDSVDPSDATWGGFQKWSNLLGIYCGHWIDPAVSGGSYWHLNPQISTSARGQTVQHLFCNMQERDNTTGFDPPPSTYCTGGVPDGISDIAHLFYLKFRPSLNTVEGYMLSSNSGLWATGSGNAFPFCTSSTPVNLFGTVAWAGIPSGTGWLPSPSQAQYIVK
jgi:hypothetical protein